MEKKDAIAANLSSVNEPRESKSTSVPYPSPPSSPIQPRTHDTEVPRVSGDGARLDRTASSAPLSLLTTPPRTSSALTVHEDKPAAKSIDVAALRTALGLDGKCGGPKKKSGNLCNNWSPAVNKTKVALKLKSMTSLTQSSTELEAALSALVELVHCSLHNCGNPKDSRIDAWRREFPVGKVKPNPATVVEKQIRELLKLHSTACIEEEEYTQDQEHERRQHLRGIGGQRVHNCAATIDEIIKPEVYLDYAILDGFLKLLETNMRCPQHIDKQPLKKWAGWKSRIAKIIEEQQVKSIESGRSEMEGAPSFNPDNLGSESTLTETNCDPNSRDRRLPRLNLDRDLSKYWPAAYDISPFNITLRSNRQAGYKSSHEQVKSAITRELAKQHTTSGYVYVYEVEGNAGFVKIGYTTRSVEERHQEWEFECNRAPKIIYPASSARVEKVKNVKRVEALCHAELDHLRVNIYCKNCLKKHVEWFEESHAQAIAVVQKWSTWMGTDPYHQPYDLRSGGKWTIKEEERERTVSMPHFMMELSAAAKQVMASGSQVGPS